MCKVFSTVKFTSKKHLKAFVVFRMHKAYMNLADPFESNGVGNCRWQMLVFTVIWWPSHETANHSIFVAEFVLVYIIIVIILIVF